MLFYFLYLLSNFFPRRYFNYCVRNNESGLSYSNFLYLTALFGLFPVIEAYIRNFDDYWIKISRFRNFPKKFLGTKD